MVPTKTEGYRFSHSECKDNTIITWNNSLWAAEIENMNNGEISCKLYFDKENSPAKDYILSHIDTINTRDTFDKALTEITTGIIYEGDDDYGTTYYFAGAPTDNYLQFGGYWWRIIRINGDNTIRIIYAGSTYDYPEGLPNGYDDSTTLYETIGTNQYHNAVSGQRFVGYYSAANQIHGTTDTSNIAKVLDNWYSTNLQDYNDYISQNTMFCNDRTAYKSESGGTETTQTSAPLYFGSYVRLVNGKKPTFKCSNENDAFTKTSDNSYSSLGNGALNQPIGLISADEVSFAGGVFANSNNKYYLYTNTTYWTISPHSFETSSPKMMKIAAAGGINVTNGIVNNASTHTRPVINLKADIELTGSGTSSDPYVVTGTEPEAIKLNEKILANANTQITRTDFTTPVTATTTGTIYYEDTRDGKTYYFAGNPTDNWIKFAGFYWRIIRINEDGTIRMIYQGTSANTTGAGTQIGTSAFNNYYNDNAYVGYMYGTPNSNTYEETHKNINDSDIKKVLDTWYENNLKNYEKNIDGNAGFCGDRAINSDFGYKKYTTEYPGITLSFKQRPPTFTCTNSTDLYTTKGSTRGNNALKYPIGLITADEIIFAGGIFSDYDNKNFYLYTNEYYWGITPYYFNSSSAGVISVGGDYGFTVNTSLGVRPVINVRNDILYAGGNGTSSNPYIIN